VNEARCKRFEQHAEFSFGRHHEFALAPVTL
jgi:hypothetical protein